MSAARRRVVIRALMLGPGVLVGAVGVLVAPVMLPWCTVIGAAIAGAVYVGAVRRAGSTSAQVVRACREVSLLAGAVATAGSIVAISLVVLLGAAGGPVILFLFLVGIRGMWRGLRRMLVWTPVRAASRPVPDRPPVVVEVVVAAEVPTAELCLAWRRSYLALADTPSGPARERIVGLRRDLLDELERRDHAGFSRWIETGARAAGDPGPYLGRP